MSMDNANDKKDVCVFTLTVLRSMINEQISIRQLRRNGGSYIYQAFKDQATRKDWIE